MALTPEDVVNKRFQPTKFREGYDQDEVDDFLDEVVVELRRLNQENEELRQRLVAADSRIDELQRSGAAAAPAAQPRLPAAGRPPPHRCAVPPQAAGAAVRRRRAGQHQQPAAARPPPPRGARARGHREARRAHRRGPRHRRARRLRGRERKQRAQLGALEQERVAPRARIDELRTFEREYRPKLQAATSRASCASSSHDADRRRSVAASRRRRLSSQSPVSAGASTSSAPAPTFQGFGGLTRRPRKVGTVSALLVLAVVALGVYGLDQFSEVPRRLEPRPSASSSRCSATFLQLHFVTQLRARPSRSASGMHLDLHDRRRRRDRVHHLVRPAHPVRRLGGRVRAAARRRARQPHRPAVPRARVRRRATSIDFISRLDASRRSSTSPTSRSSSSMVPVHAPDARGVGLDGTATTPSATDEPPRRRRPARRRSEPRRRRTPELASRPSDMEHALPGARRARRGARRRRARASCSASRAPSRPRSPRPAASRLDGASARQVRPADARAAGSRSSWTPQDGAARSCPIAGARISGSCYDDDDIVVVDKPVGVAAHPSRRLGRARRSLGALAAAGFRISTSGAAERAGHRAPPRRRHERAHGRREDRARLHRAQARVPRPRGREDLPRGRAGPSRPARRARSTRPIGRHPQLRLEVRGHRRRQALASRTTRRSRRSARASLLEVHLETGRTHQIRVHMAAQRHPCVGDLHVRRRPDAVGAARPHPAVAARRAARLHAPGDAASGRRSRSQYPADLATRARRAARRLTAAAIDAVRAHRTP